jgi:hypothetical protein
MLRGETQWEPLKCMGSLFPEGATEPFKRGSLLLLGKGSTRGVLLEPRDNQINIDLLMQSSELDWEISRWLMAVALNAGAEVTEEGGKALGPAELEPAAFKVRVQETHRQEWGITREISAKDSTGNLRLPVAHFELHLSRQQLETSAAAALMDSLVKQCYVYGNAYMAWPMGIQKPDGTVFKQAHYSSISTLVPADIEGMTFSGADGYYIEDAVALDHVKKVLAEKITVVGKYLYFPPIQWGKEPALLEALSGKPIAEIQKSLQEQLTRSLLRLPVLTFLLVAHVDGKADEKEAQAMFDFVNAAAADQKDQTTFANVCRRLQREMKAVHADAIAGNCMADFQLGIGQINCSLKPEAAIAFKKRLYDLAETIAKASGGGLLGMGSISKEEQQALDWMKKQLIPAE